MSRETEVLGYVASFVNFIQKHSRACKLNYKHGHEGLLINKTVYQIIKKKYFRGEEYEKSN